MAPKKIKPEVLRSFVPTEAEIEQAKKELDTMDNKAKRAKMAAMTAFVKRNDADPVIMGSKGKDRLAYLEAYLAFTARKNATVQTSKTFESTLNKRIEARYMNKFQLETAFGTDVASLWISSGKLVSRPDRITGSKGPEHLEYEIPDDITVKDDIEKNTLSVGASSEAKDEDMENMKGFKLEEGSPTMLASNIVKVEKKTAADLTKEKVLAFCADPSKLNAEIEFHMLELKLLMPRFENLKYSHELVKDAGKLQTRLTWYV